VNDGELTPDQIEFLAHWGFVIEAVPYPVNSEDYREWHDHISAMLSQANRWGQLKAAKHLREWADEFGTTPTQQTIKSIVYEGAERIEKEAGYGPGTPSDSASVPGSSPEGD
jgi:hypothetical protein